jgi:hypothetical protein
MLSRVTRQNRTSVYRALFLLGELDIHGLRRMLKRADLMSELSAASDLRWRGANG